MTDLLFWTVPEDCITPAIEAFMAAAAEVSRLQRLRLLCMWYLERRLDKPELRQLIPDLWATGPGEISLGVDVAVALFEEAGFVYRHLPITPPATRWTAPPAGKVDLWRGSFSATNGIGMSWTLDVEIARQFARNCAAHGGPATVWKTTVPGERVLALFHHWGQAEAIIDPYQLRPVAIVDRFDPIPDGRRMTELTTLSPLSVGPQ